MIYEQSLKNVEIVKNFASPLEGYFVFFNFKNDTEFEVEFIAENYKSKEFEDYEDIKRNGHRAGLPFACIWFNSKNFDLEIQYDDTILLYEANLTKNILIDHSLKEIPRDSKGLKEGFLGLIKLLKNK